MKKLLIITQKVDSRDQLLGFFIGWIKEFSKSFNKITILCLESNEVTLPGNVRVISLGKDRGLSKPSQLLNFYKNIYSRRDEYDYVFVHMNPIWVVLGSIPWKLMNKGVFLWYTTKGVTVKLRLATLLVDKIFTASKESFRIQSKKVVVTGHGIDTDLFRPEDNKEVNKSICILSVGRLAPVKNYETLIEASKILNDQGFDFSVTLIGQAALAKDRAYEIKIKNLIKEYGLTDRFKFLGKISHENLPGIYREYDLFVHLSQTGSLDKVILEAIASGLNPISCNDASRSFLDQEHVFSNNNPSELADKIIAQSGKPFRSDLREYVVENHGLSKLVNKISNIISAKKVLIAGYVHVDETALKTFEHYPEAESLEILVPDVWPIKNGKHIFRPTKRRGVNLTKAFFTHSNYPIVGGLLKGWMPLFPLILLRQRPDVVFTTSEPNLLTTLYQALFTKLSGAKHIVFTWENIPYNIKFRGMKGGLQRLIVSLNLSLSDGVICGSKRSEQIIRNITNKPMACIPSGGAETEFFVRDYSKKTFKGQDLKESIVFSFIGAIDYRKGLHITIEAFSEVLKAIPSSKLIIAGNGEYESGINDLIIKYGLTNSVQKIPWLDRSGVRELLNASDIFVYPSIPHNGWEEQFGYSLIEASLMEVPIISTNSGSIPEVVINGKTGILIEPSDVDSLVRAMLDLGGDKDKREAMGKAGREFVNETYSREVVARKFYNFFNRV